MKVLSLGWGVQSFTLLCMAAEQEIEIDYAIHADTGFERTQTYEVEKTWTKRFESQGIKIIRAENLPAREKFLNSNQVFIPAHTSNGGMLMRTCTDRWKISPIRREIQKLRQPKEQVEMLLGITTDEWQRMKPSQVKYITNIYPLIDKKMSRLDCIKWLTDHHYPIPVKSSCVFCPYHSAEAWREVKKSNDWDKAVEIDEKIRHKMPGCKLFVNANRLPLAEMPDQQSLFNYDNDECSGYCFI